MKRLVLLSLILVACEPTYVYTTDKKLVAESNKNTPMAKYESHLSNGISTKIVKIGSGTFAKLCIVAATSSTDGEENIEIHCFLD